MQKDGQDHARLTEIQIQSEVYLSVLPPLVSRELFAQVTGASMDTVRGWAQTDTIPTVKIGRQRLINLGRLIQDLNQGKRIFKQGDYQTDG